MLAAGLLVTTVPALAGLSLLVAQKQAFAPTYSSVGSIEISSLPGTSGNDLALVASGDITSTNAVAVGTTVDTTTGATGGMIVIVAGVSMTPAPLPAPANAASNPNVALTGLQCPSGSSPDNCFVVGSYQINAGSGGGRGGEIIIVAGSYTAIEAPLPSNASTVPAVTLTGLSCPDLGHCGAIGTYQDNLGLVQSFFEIYSGSTWVPVEAPEPFGAGTNPALSLQSVDCPVAGTCFAVGHYTDKAGNLQGVAVSDIGGTPATTAMPLPALFSGSPAVALPSLGSVSCASASSCAASGYYLDSMGDTHGIIENYASSSWSPLATPRPSNASAAGPDKFGNISCAAPGDCGAVEVYSDTSANSDGRLFWEAGGLQAYADVQVPAGTSTTSLGDVPVISCSVPVVSFASDSATCTTAQTYLSGTDLSGKPIFMGSADTIVQRTQPVDVGGTPTLPIQIVGLSLVTPPSNAAANPSVQIDSLHCVQPHSCWSTGTYIDPPAASRQSLYFHLQQTVPTVTSVSPASAPLAGGGRVTVGGTGFLGATSVAFGAHAPANVTIVSDTQMTATVPAGSSPGRVDVTVADEAGTSATGTDDGFVYVTPESYQPVNPFRICDTRRAAAANPCNGNGTVSGTLPPNGTLGVQVAGEGSVPAVGVEAVVANVTVTGTTAGGYLTIWPAGTSRPLASSLNWSAGETIANLVEIELGSSGRLEVFNSAGSTDVIIDVEGYVASLAAGTGLFNPLTPGRVCDTRVGGGVSANQCNGNGAVAGTLQPGTMRTVTVAGLAGVPAAGAAAVVLNVTATDTTAAGGYLTIWPTGSSRPLASNVDFGARATIPNRVIVKLGSTGAINIYNYSGSTDVLVDVSGWFTDSSNAAATGAKFTPSSPIRFCDTRSGTANECTGMTLGAGGILSIGADGVGGIPASGVVGLAVNVTATDTTGWSYLTIYPAGTSTPPTSDLNWTAAGTSIPNLVEVKVPASGAGTGVLKAYNASGGVDVIFDLSGWYS